MNKINIETYENEKKANYKIYIDEKLELDVKGLKYTNTIDLMDEITRSYERYVSMKQPGKTVIQGPARYAGYSEIGQALEIMPCDEPFTSKDLARLIVNETSSKFPQTFANVSSVLSALQKLKNWYPDWIEPIGKQGRSRLYRKTRNVSTEQIESDLRKATKKA